MSTRVECGKNACCKRAVCAAWAFTRRADGVTQDGAKVAGWTFLKGQKKVDVRRLRLQRELTSWCLVFQPCLRRSARSGPTGPPLHTGTEHRYWSSAKTGEGREKCPDLFVSGLTCNADGYMHYITGHQCYVRILPHRWCRCYTKSQGGTHACQRQIRLHLKTV